MYIILVVAKIMDGGGLTVVCQPRQRAEGGGVPVAGYNVGRTPVHHSTPHQNVTSMVDIVRRKPTCVADEKCIVDDYTVHDAAAPKVDVEPVTHNNGDAGQHKSGHRLSPQEDGGAI